MTPIKLIDYTRMVIANFGRKATAPYVSAGELLDLLEELEQLRRLMTDKSLEERDQEITQLRHGG
jgi:hypothetical protein